MIVSYNSSEKGNCVSFHNYYYAINNTKIIDLVSYYFP